MIRTLKYFDNKTKLPTALAQFFKDIDVPINQTGDAPGSIENVLSAERAQAFKSICQDAYFYGLVNNDAFEGIDTNLRLNNFRGKSYDAILVFGIDIKRLNTEGEEIAPTRTQLFNMCRAFNKEYPEMPVVVVFRYLNHFISIGVCERLAYKRTDKQGDKIGKVSLIRDIDTRDGKTHEGHRRILGSLAIQRSGKNAVNTFEQLYNYWISVLNVSILNKRFYEEISNWYFWALREVTFPNEPQLQSNESKEQYDERLKTHRANNVIRLITRLIFTWFLKEKKLIPDTIFDIDELTEVVDFKSLIPSEDSSSSVYYTAILQNLFFATLNQEMDSRRFKSDKTFQGRNEDFDNKTVYRYKDYFKSEAAAIRLFKDIPFLNGGLFECLDQPAKKIVIDGFSEKEQPHFPNRLFFQKEDIAYDLNDDYGTKGKKYKVKGIIEILKSYKFTVAENTPLEEEVALDPELLGRIFENLLASYNPETKTSARKQTGSFYTPREIVNYMVDESLLAYLKNAILESHAGALELGKQQIKIFEAQPNKKGQLALETLPNTSKWQGKESELDAKLRSLFAPDNSQPFTDEADIQHLINALDNCKILDPACGSGAFPMGILHRMVALLHKLDPNNTRWKQRQLDNADTIEDTTAREEAIKAIEKAFDKNELDYGRKLYLIENCIYGVDIQPIAVQIAKLRFFISLICEQKMDDTEGVENNRGVLALPNLETKFVAANTLIGLDTANLIKPVAVEKLTKERKELHHRIFSAKRYSQKKIYRSREEELRTKIKDELMIFNSGGNIQQLADWNPFDQNASAPFFDADWMFNIKNGFDIVIGNPPYHQLSKDNSAQVFYKNYLKNRYKTSGGRLNTFIFFTHLGIELLKKNGIISFIIPNTILTQEYYKETRKYILDKTELKQVVSYEELPFENAVVENISFVAIKKTLDNYPILHFTSDINNVKFDISKWKAEFYKTETLSFNFRSNSLTEIINRDSVELSSICAINQAIALKGDKLLSVRKENPNKEYYRLLDGRNIDKYQIKWIDTFLDYDLNKIHSCKTKDIFLSKEKLFFRRVSNKLVFAYDNEQFFALNTLVVVNLKESLYFKLKYLLGVLNSRLINYYYVNKHKSTKIVFSEIQAKSVGELPIKNLVLKKQILFEYLVNILIYQKRTPSVPAYIGQYFEQVIDGMVCELYFEEEMKSKGVDIIGLVSQDLAALPPFDTLSDEDKQAQIHTLYRKWTAPASEINNRLVLMPVRSPDVLGVILEGK